MRYPKEQKSETRRRILGAAARLFRESGYDGVGVDSIMAEVGLTPGGFYSHFPSKEALFAEAMATALDPNNTLRVTSKSALPGTDALTALIKGYLSRAHRDAVADGCPLPTLTPDVARRSETTRESYEHQFLRYVNEIEALLQDTPEARERALAIIAQCVGGLMLSRAVNSENLSTQILKSCRHAAMSMRDDDSLNK